MGWGSRKPRESMGIKPTNDVTPLPPDRWAPFPEGGTLFVRRPALKKGDPFSMRDLTTMDVPPDHFVVILSRDQVEGRIAGSTRKD